MVATTPKRTQAEPLPPEIKNRIAGVRLSTHFDVNSSEPVEFLKSVAEVTQSHSESLPTQQEIECLRQAAWKYTRQTAEPVANGRDLLAVLDRLGYV